MDPVTKPSRSTEETRSSAGADSQETVSTRRTEAGGQVSQEVRTSAASPTGTSFRAEQTTGLTPEAAGQYQRKKSMFRAYQVIWYLLGLIEVFLLFRFLLKLAGANPVSGFVQFVYGISYPFAAPFLETFRATPATGAETTSFFEWSTIIAGIVYLLVAWGIVKLMQLGKPAEPGEVERTISEV